MLNALRTLRPAVWDYFEVPADGPRGEVVPDLTMPGTTWFPGRRRNYAETVLQWAGRRPDAVAIHTYSQSREPQRMTYSQLAQEVSRVAGWLREKGVQAGDRWAMCRTLLSRRRLPRHGQHRRDLGELRQRFRRPGRHRPFRPDRAGRALRGGGLCLRGEEHGTYRQPFAGRLWREAYHLVDIGAVSVADLDLAIANGPGLLWALAGPFATQHLSGGGQGIGHILEHLGPPMVQWWDDLGHPQLSDELIAKIVAGVDAELADRDETDLLRRRDAALVGLLHLKDRADVD